MKTVDLQISKRRSGRVTVELDMKRLERLADALGFYTPDFLSSLDRAEQDLKTGNVKKLRSMKDLA